MVKQYLVHEDVCSSLRFKGKKEKEKKKPEWTTSTQSWPTTSREMFHGTASWRSQSDSVRRLSVSFNPFAAHEVATSGEKQA